MSDETIGRYEVSRLTMSSNGTTWVELAEAGVQPGSTSMACATLAFAVANDSTEWSREHLGKYVRVVVQDL